MWSKHIPGQGGNEYVGMQVGGVFKEKQGGQSGQSTE